MTVLFEWILSTWAVSTIAALLARAIQMSRLATVIAEVQTENGYIPFDMWILYNQRFALPLLF